LINEVSPGAELQESTKTDYQDGAQEYAYDNAYPRFRKAVVYSYNDRGEVKTGVKNLSGGLT